MYFIAVLKRIFRKSCCLKIIRKSNYISTFYYSFTFVILNYYTSSYLFHIYYFLLS